MKKVTQHLSLIFLIVLFSSLIFGGHQEHFLQPGEKLLPGQYLNFGAAYLKLQDDGNLVLYVFDQVMWASNTNGRRAKELIMQHDGNLVFYGQNNAVLFATNTDGRPGAFLRISEEANGMKIFQNHTTPIWSVSKGRHY